jgi:hypothetical protein
MIHDNDQLYFFVSDKTRVPHQAAFRESRDFKCHEITICLHDVNSLSDVYRSAAMGRICKWRWWRSRARCQDEKDAEAQSHPEL